MGRECWTRDEATKKANANGRPDLGCEGLTIGLYKQRQSGRGTCSLARTVRKRKGVKLRSSGLHPG